MSRAVRAVPGVLGILIFCAAWELIGTFRLAGLTWPALSTVLAFVATPSNAPLLGRAAGATFLTVGLGYLLGTAIGFALAMLVRVARPTRAGIDRLVALIHATPAIALAPVFMIFVGHEHVSMAVAALAVFYLVYVATTSGLESAHRAYHDLFSVLGAKPSTRFSRLELPAALPAIVSGLKLAIPVAFLGAIVGEWFGASRGLGLLMVSAMQNFQIPLLWSAVLLTMLPSLLLYLLMGLVETVVQRRFA